jgi:hypothetical protein
MPGRNREKPNEEHHQRKLDARGCGLSTIDRGGGSEKPAHLPQEPRLPDGRPLAAGDAEEGDVAAARASLQRIHPAATARRDELRHAEVEGRVERKAERGLHRQRAAPLRRALVVRRRLVLHGCRSRARVYGRPDRQQVTHPARLALTVVNARTKTLDTVCISDQSYPMIFLIGWLKTDKIHHTVTLCICERGPRSLALESMQTAVYIVDEDKRRAHSEKKINHPWDLRWAH